LEPPTKRKRSKKKKKNKGAGIEENVGTPTGFTILGDTTEAAKKKVRLAGCCRMNRPVFFIVHVVI
jgi:hypothetical protein